MTSPPLAQPSPPGIDVSVRKFLDDIPAPAVMKWRKTDALNQQSEAKL